MNGASVYFESLRPGSGLKLGFWASKFLHSSVENSAQTLASNPFFWGTVLKISHGKNKYEAIFRKGLDKNGDGQHTDSKQA